MGNFCEQRKSHKQNNHEFFMDFRAAGSKSLDMEIKMASF